MKTDALDLTKTNAPKLRQSFLAIPHSHTPVAARQLAGLNLCMADSELILDSVLYKGMTLGPPSCIWELYTSRPNSLFSAEKPVRMIG